jgi:hypothetical protein
VTVQKIGDVIANSGDLGSLVRQSKRLSGLQNRLFTALPPALATACRVASLKSGKLRVLASNPAVAAKLRQLVPRLMSHLQNQGFEVTGIQVDVQVKAHKIKDEQDFTKQPLAPEAIRKIEALAAQLPPSSVRSALVRMARRGQKPKG